MDGGSGGNEGWTRNVTITPSDIVGSGDPFEVIIKYVQADAPKSSVKFKVQESNETTLNVYSNEVDSDGFIPITGFDTEGNTTIDLYDISLVNGLEFNIFPVESERDFSWLYNLIS